MRSAYRRAHAWSTARPVQRTIRNVFVIALVVAMMLPILVIIVRPLENLDQNLADLGALPNLGSIYLNTVLLAVGAVGIGTGGGLLLAWSAAQLSGSWAKVAQILGMAPLFVPPIAGVLGWVLLLTPEVGYLNVLMRELPFWKHLESGPVDVRSLTWIIIITGLYEIPFVFSYLYPAIQNVDPGVQRAAQTCGSSWIGTQFRIVLPLVRPAVVYSSVLVVVIGLGQFVVPLILGRNRGIDVVTTEVFRQLESSATPQIGVATLLAVPIVAASIILIIFQRQSLRNIDKFSSMAKGATVSAKSRNYLAVPLLLYVVTAVVLPVVALVIVALSPFWSATIDVASFSLRNFERVIADATVQTSIANSLMLSVIAVVIALAISCVLAVFINSPTKEGRLKQFLVRAVDYTANLPLSVPHVILGVGIFVVFAVGPLHLYGTRAVFVVAYLVLYLPYGIRGAQSALSQIDPKLETAARVSGAKNLFAFVTVTLPLMRGALMSTGILMFVLMAREFSASALLRTPTNQVMATRLYDAWTNGTYTDTAAMALIMIIISLLGASIVMVFRGRSTTRTEPSRQERGVF